MPLVDAENLADVESARGTRSGQCFLGELLLQCVPWVLLDILSNVDESRFSLEQSISILTSTVTGKEQTLRNSYVPSLS